MKTIRSFAAAMVLGVVALTGLRAEQVMRQAQSTSKTSPTSQPATQPASPPVFVGQKPDEWESYQAMHAYMLDRFVKSEGFGLRRVIRVQDLLRSKRIYADGTRYYVGRMELLSLNDGKEPFVYVVGNNASVVGRDDILKNQLKTAKHRALDENESAALEDIKKGKEVILTGSGAGRQLIGAVRAVGECAKCHQVPENTLLGAFRYPLIEEATFRKQLAR